MHAAVQSITGIYGDDSSGGGNGRAAQCAIPEYLESAEVIEITDADDEGSPPLDYDAPCNGQISPVQSTEPITQVGQPSTGCKSVGEQEIDFSNCDKAEQLNVLETMIKRKAYDASKFPKPMAEFNEANRVSLFKKLLTLPDADHDGNLGF